MYARNISALLLHMVQDGALAIDLSDELQAGVVVTMDGQVVHAALADTAKAGPAQAGPAQAGPAQAGPAQAGPAQAGPAQAGPAQADSAGGTARVDGTAD
jgi:hypothetical protein